MKINNKKLNLHFATTICIKRLQEVQEEKNTSEHIVSDETTTIPITTFSSHFSESSEDEYEKLLDIEEFSRELRLVQEKGQGFSSSLYTIFHNFKKFLCCTERSRK